MSEKKYYEDPSDIPEEEVEIIEECDCEDESLCGAPESFEESKERPNEK